MVFAGQQYAEADAPPDHYQRLLKLRLPVVLGERGRGAPGLSAGLDGRRRIPRSRPGLSLDGQEVVCGPGAHVAVAPGQHHSFWNPGTDSAAYVTTIALAVSRTISAHSRLDFTRPDPTNKLPPSASG